MRFDSLVVTKLFAIAVGAIEISTPLLVPPGGSFLTYISLGQSSLPDTCLVCAHTPLSADLCKPNKALRTTLKAFLRTEEKKREKERPSATPVAPSETPQPSATPATPVADASTESIKPTIELDQPPINGTAEASVNESAQPSETIAEETEDHTATNGAPQDITNSVHPGDQSGQQVSVWCVCCVEKLFTYHNVSQNEQTVSEVDDAAPNPTVSTSPETIPAPSQTESGTIQNPLAPPESVSDQPQPFANAMNVGMNDMGGPNGYANMAWQGPSNYAQMMPMMPNGMQGGMMAFPNQMGRPHLLTVYVIPFITATDIPV